MKTKNLKLDFIQPLQLNKEVCFNENLAILDQFSAQAVKAFVPSFPSDEYKDFKFIITEGEHKNKICYNLGTGRGWQTIAPTPGMVLFCLDTKQFTYFCDGVWQISKPEIAPPSSGVAGGAGATAAAAVIAGPAASAVHAPAAPISYPEIKFVGAMGDHIISQPINWLYLNGASKLQLKHCKSPKIDIIIKQNAESIFNVSFDSPILWKAESYVSSTAANSMDYIKLIKLPETEHYLGEVVKVGLSY